MLQKKEPESFDVFAQKSGSWKFIGRVDAKTPGEAKELAMSEHRLLHWNRVCVHPTK